MMETIIIESLDELGERWEWLKHQGVEKLLITESHPKGEENSCVVEGLSMELEDDYVMCYDINATIMQMFSILVMFLRESLTRILLLPIHDGYRERLEFSDGGVIYIEKA